MNDISNLITGLGIIGVVLLVCGLFILACVVNAWSTLKRELLGKKDEREISFAQQPVSVDHAKVLTVQKAQQFVSRPELEAVAAQVSGLDVDLKTLRREIVENGERRRASIEGKVEASRKECREHTENVRLELGEKLDGMEGRIIATLKNTGAI